MNNVRASRNVLSLVIGLVVASAGAAEFADYPRAWAPFERGGAERLPVKLEVKAFSYGTNLWWQLEGRS